MRSIEKRELLLASLDKQYLLGKGLKQDIVSSLCGLQAQFANNPGHALRIRAEDFASHEWQDGLVKTWTFRHTLHTIRRDELSLFLSAVGVPEEWDDGWGIGRQHKPGWAARLLAWIEEGAGEREELKARCRAKRMRPELLDLVFHGWGGLLSEMCRRGMIAYQPGTAKTFVACAEFQPMDRDAARAEILRRYFRHLGPASLQDCATFTGFRKTVILELLNAYSLPLRSVVGNGTEYWYMEEWDTGKDIPPCLYLTGFDQLLLAYRDRSRLLEERHKPDVVTNTGIIHPTVLVDGTIQAKWRKDGPVLRVTPFKRLNKRQKKLVAAKGEELFAGEVTAVVFLD